MLSANRARRMMSKRKATKLVEYVLNGVPARAKNGYYDIRVECSDNNIYTEHDIEVAEARLRKLGYNVSCTYGSNSVWFLINWRK